MFVQIWNWPSPNRFNLGRLFVNDCLLTNEEFDAFVVCHREIYVLDIKII